MGIVFLTVIGAVYSQPANTGAGTHTMSLLYTVVNFLKVKMKLQIAAQVTICLRSLFI
jgi:hypothetical protein